MTFLLAVPVLSHAEVGDIASCLRPGLRQSREETRIYAPFLSFSEAEFRLVLDSEDPLERE